MAGWLLPAIKLVAGNLDTIIDTAKPFFTKRRATDPNDQAVLVQQQITELQSAVSGNNAQIHQLAQQLQQTIAALEQGAQEALARERKSRQLTMVSLVVSGLAILLAIAALVAGGKP